MARSAQSPNRRLSHHSPTLVLARTHERITVEGSLKIAADGSRVAMASLASSTEKLSNPTSKTPTSQLLTRRWPPEFQDGIAGHQKRPRKNKKFNYQFPNHRPWSPAFTSRSSSWDFCVSMVERRERLIHDRHREEDMVDLSSSSLELTV